MSLRLVRRLESLYNAAGRRFPRGIGRELVTHGILPSFARLVGLALIAGLMLAVFLPLPFSIALWSRYIALWQFAASDWLVLGISATPLMVGLLTLFVSHLISKPLTTLVQSRMLRLSSCALLAIATPGADAILLILASAAAISTGVLFAPRAALWLGLIKFDPDSDSDRERR